MNNQLVVLGPDEIIDSGLSGINEKDLPIMIQGQISKLNELDKSVKKAMRAAAAARDSATNAKKKSAGIGKKKVAIEELQSAGIDLAEAVQSGAEAQRVSFEFQTKIPEISKYLFGLGVSNITSNRFVVRELELRLKGASQKELSELARQELVMVVKQLKEQEDILRKQDNFSKMIKSHDERLTVQAQKYNQMAIELKRNAELDQHQNDQIVVHEKTMISHEEQLKNHHESVKRHEQLLKIHSEINKKLEKELGDLVENDRLISEQLQDQIDNIKLHDDQLNIQAKTDKRLEEKMQAQAEIGLVHEGQLANLHEMYHDLHKQMKINSTTIKVQEKKITLLNDEIVNLKTLLETKADNTKSKYTLAIASTAMVVSVIHLLL